MFKKVLVANRGEIAVRIIRTLAEMDIKSVAVYSTADADSLAVSLADEAICIGGPQPADSYLNMVNILSAAVLTGAEAIHPGFGFLAENAEFAQLCADCQLTFIGPQPETIRLMGDKANARVAMQKNKIPVIPGSTGFVTDVDTALKVAEKVGYPVMLKAAAGGGGKGIRKLKTPADLQANFPVAQQEAASAFNDARMYLEKIITAARHIEVQVLRDQAGHCVALPERDCSAQLNQQKILEESPASGLTEKQQQAIGETARAAANALNYVNTGTFEFLLTATGQWYFMEMNTRIQVEHPVTELVTGLDLVREQIRIAAGESLTNLPALLPATGHAIECRLNAVDAAHDFRPAAGKITAVRWPVGNPGVRIDTSFNGPTTISPFYDSMIAKVLSVAPTRQQAICRLQRVLRELQLNGLPTNQAFQAFLLAQPTFQQGELTTTTVAQVILPQWQQFLQKRVEVHANH